MQNPENPSPLKDWLETRTPAVPLAFLPYLLEPGGEVHGKGDLTALGLLALSQALAEPGKDREGAFHLLTADAFLTYACETVAEGEEDIRDGLERVLGQVGEVYR
jgi:hypothetical protein